MDVIKNWCYHLPAWTAIIVMLLVALCWGIIGQLIIGNKKKWIVVNGFLLYVAFALILYKTLISRFGMNLSNLHNEFIPFCGKWEYLGTIAGWQDAVLNAFLFEPIGLSISSLMVVQNSVGKTILWTVMIAACLSLIIELSQGIFTLGTFETEDLICNTFGAFFGALSVLLLKRNINKKI